MLAFSDRVRINTNTDLAIGFISIDPKVVGAFESKLGLGALISGARRLWDPRTTPATESSRAH